MEKLHCFKSLSTLAYKSNALLICVCAELIEPLEYYSVSTHMHTHGPNLCNRALPAAQHWELSPFNVNSVSNFKVLTLSKVWLRGAKAINKQTNKQKTDKNNNKTQQLTVHNFIQQWLECKSIFLFSEIFN